MYGLAARSHTFDFIGGGEGGEGGGRRRDVGMEGWGWCIAGMKASVQPGSGNLKSLRFFLLMDFFFTQLTCARFFLANSGCRIRKIVIRNKIKGGRESFVEYKLQSYVRVPVIT